MQITTSAPTTSAPTTEKTAKAVNAETITVAPVQRPKINGGLFNGQRPSIFSVNRPLPRIRPPVPVGNDVKAVAGDDTPKQEKVNTIHCLSHNS